MVSLEVQYIASVFNRFFEFAAEIKYNNLDFMRYAQNQFPIPQPQPVNQMQQPINNQQQNHLQNLMHLMKQENIQQDSSVAILNNSNNQQNQPSTLNTFTYENQSILPNQSTQSQTQNTIVQLQQEQAVQNQPQPLSQNTQERLIRQQLQQQQIEEEIKQEKAELQNVLEQQQLKVQEFMNKLKQITLQESLSHNNNESKLILNPEQDIQEKQCHDKVTEKQHEIRVQQEPKSWSLSKKSNIYIYPMYLFRTIVYKELKNYRVSKLTQVQSNIENKNVSSMKELIEKIWRVQSPQLQKKIKALAETLRQNVKEKRHVYDYGVVSKYLVEHDLDYDIWTEAKKRFENKKKQSNTQIEEEESYDDFSDPDEKRFKSQPLSQNTRKSNRLEQKRTGGSTVQQTKRNSPKKKQSSPEHKQQEEQQQPSSSSSDEDNSPYSQQEEEEDHNQNEHQQREIKDVKNEEKEDVNMNDEHSSVKVVNVKKEVSSNNNMDVEDEEDSESGEGSEDEEEDGEEGEEEEEQDGEIKDTEMIENDQSNLKQSNIDNGIIDNINDSKVADDDFYNYSDEKSHNPKNKIEELTNCQDNINQEPNSSMSHVNINATLNQMILKKQKLEDALSCIQDQFNQNE